MQLFHAKLHCQKPMLRQIEWELRNEPIIKDRVFPVATLSFFKFCFIVRNSYKV